jgi:hypothetical protein
MSDSDEIRHGSDRKRSDHLTWGETFFKYVDKSYRRPLSREYGYFEIKKLSIELGRSAFVDELELKTFPEKASHIQKQLPLSELFPETSLEGASIEIEANMSLCRYSLA